MKKTIFFLFLTTGIMVVSSSCRRYYESVPVEQVTSDYIWDPTDSNAINANQYLTTVYAQLQNGFNRIDQDFLDAGSDDAVTAKTSATSITLFATSGITVFNNPEASVWTNSYSAIRKSTVFLNNFGVVPLKNTYDKRSWFGEARALRAFFYWELVRRWGGIPIVGDSVKGLDDDVQLPRRSFESCINYIVSECDRAADSLREDPVDDNNYGRFSKAGVMALKARVLLYAASPLYNGGNIGDSLTGYAAYDAARWKRAADAAKAVMDLGKYSLEADFKNIFISQRSAEVIFARTNGQGTGVESANGPINFSTAPGQGNTSPTQELVDAYGMSNGKPITDATSGYNMNKPYDGRDPRFYATVLYNGAPWLNTTIQTFTGGLQRPGGTATQTRTGYYMRKFLGDFETGSNYSNQYHDWIYFRYAEVLLNYAEALNESDGPTTDVYTAIETIRQRAGLNPYQLETGLSQAAMRDIIHNERHKELAFEEQRFWDIRRWKIAEQVYNQPLHGINIAADGNGGFSYTEVPVLQTSFEAKAYFYPIPYNELVSNDNLVQNPGW